MSRLFQPFSIGSLTLLNRIVIAPMCQYSAEDGSATDWHLMHLGALSHSGAGLLVIEATAVSPEGRISPADLGLYSDANEAALARVLKGIRAYSSMPLSIQLAHAGRKASVNEPWRGGAQIKPGEPRGWQTLAPSAVPFAEGENPPHALTETALTRIKSDFAAAAHRAVRLGLDGIEVHAAHGYLLHEFLSPLSNQRQDRYGGSLENRMRFPLEVFEAIHDAVPSGYPLWLRVSASDWVPGGWDVEGTVDFARELKARGCAAMHVSSGGLTPTAQIKVGPGFQVDFARRVKEETGMTTIAVGLITDPEQAEEIVATGKADAVALARGILYDPRWPWHAAAKLGAQVSAPPQFWRSEPAGVRHLFKPA